MKFPIFSKTYFQCVALLLASVCASVVHSLELAGRITDEVYYSPDGFFSTKLPELQGEIRDFPNAVSVFNASTGAQDSFEYFHIPLREREKYQAMGAEDYHRQFIAEAFIGKRFKGTFEQVSLASDGLVKIDDKEVFISALNMNASSKSEAGKFSGQQLRVLLGSVVEDDTMLIYQIAETAIGVDGYKQFAERATKKLIIWLRNTTINPEAKTSPK